ncbi:MAG: chromosomal replication initiator protein DnaA [Actinobacteria bacterium]|nr:chromosomal replication initiator protein DnaA [Actinomycetota bacterium]
MWTAVAGILREQVSDAVWYSTFQDVRALPADGGYLRIGVPNTVIREKILHRYLPLVRDALEEIGVANPQLLIDVDVEAEVEHLRIAVNGESSNVVSARFDSAAPPSLSPEPTMTDGLNPRYTFETFVSGPSNQFSLAAALRVAETPARSYNPLFIYGASGLGKTHLLHAIGHYVNQNYSHYTVRYVSTETFMNEYVDAIRTQSPAMFKRRYRDIDVLLIDDIQFMEGKERLQEEFFHTFNALHGANKQIVISSDRMPDNIPTLEDRLRGRFRWGLITDIQPPDLETRLAILRNKSERDMTQVPADVLEFIAANITTNIRELEGALIRVTAYASLNRIPISVPLAQQLLSDLLSETTTRPRTPDEMLNEMASYFGLTVDALRGKSRQRDLVTSRQVSMYVFRELTDLSYPAIARLFGGRDHTTVIHAVEKIQRLMAERKQIYDQVHDLRQRLKTG